MTREVKEYEVRKKELLDAAQDLFLKQGYKDTSVRDIISSVGIAKGTFYHYFGSKEQLMKAMVDRIIDQSVEIYASVADEDSLNALDKLNLLFKKIWEWRSTNRDLDVVRLFFNEPICSMEIWHYLREKSIQKTAPILTRIIEQGVKEGDFENDYPVETGEIFVNLILDLKESVGRSIQNKNIGAKTSKLIHNKLEAFNFSIERILGVKPGSIKIYERSNK